VNNGGNIAGISHYLVCGTPAPVTFPKVLVGYADDEHGGTVHTPGAPWPPTSQAANVNFAGCPKTAAVTQDYLATCAAPSGNPPGTADTYNGDYDSSAIQLQNSSATDMNIASVTVTVNGGTASECTLDIWPLNTMVVPAGGALVLAQTTTGPDTCANPLEKPHLSIYNFDLSDSQITECVPDNIAPTITVTLMGGASKVYTDSALALTAGGNDPGSCGPRPGATSSTEATPWTATT
jgi:hypothetical protein